MSLSHIGTSASVANAGGVATDPITVNPAWPTSYTATAGDLAVVTAVSAHDTEATPTINWTADGTDSASGGGGSFGAGTGPRRLTWWWLELAGGESTPTVSLAGTNTGRNLNACITILRRTGGDFYSVVAAFGAETTAGTGWSQATSTDPGLESGDMVVVGFAVRDDQPASFTAMGITATGATISSVTERADFANSGGNDSMIGVGTADVTAGTSSAAPVITCTIGSSETGEVGVLRVREATTPAGPTVAAFESSWTTTTDPKTVAVTSCLTDDFVVVLSGGNQDSGSDITAVATTTSAGSTGSWTDPVEEDVSGAAADDWISSAIAQVTGDGTVTPQVELTHSGANTPTPWGMWVARVRGSAGLGVHGKTATSSTQVVSLTVEQDSAVLFLSVDWDAGSVGTFTPSGSTEVERAVQATTYTVHAAYWTSQAAGTRNYGHSGGGGAKYRCVAIELLAASAGETGTAEGLFGFTGTVAGVPKTPGTAAASFGFTATVAGVPETFGTAAASFGYTATVAGIPRPLGQVVAVFGFTGTASGTVGEPPVTGTAEALFGYTATASGVPETFGTAAASFGFTGTASGVDRSLGAAVAAFGFTGTVAGRPRHLGVAVASFTFAGTASGVPRVRATVVASFGFTGTAQGFAGTPPVTGIAVAAFGFTGAAAGVDRSLGTAQAAFGLTGAAQGLPRVLGQTSGVFGYTATAVGVPETFGVAVALFGFIGEAVSPPPVTQGNVTRRYRATTTVGTRHRVAAGVNVRHRETSTVGGG